MIVELILNLLKTLILFVISLFPTIPPFDMGVSLQPFVDVVTSINSFISVPLVGICLGLLLVVTNIDFVWSMIMWVVRKIPGVE